jgi:hypothetical protein
MRQRRPVAERSCHLLTLPTPLRNLANDTLSRRLGNLNFTIGQILMHVFPRDIDLLLHRRILDAPLFRDRSKDSIPLFLRAFLPWFRHLAEE